MTSPDPLGTPARQPGGSGTENGVTCCVAKQRNASARVARLAHYMVNEKRHYTRDKILRELVRIAREIGGWNADDMRTLLGDADPSRRDYVVQVSVSGAKIEALRAAISPEPSR